MELDQLYQKFEAITDKMNQLEFNLSEGQVIDELEVLIKQRESIIHEIDELGKSNTLSKESYEKLMQKNKELENKMMRYREKLIDEIEGIVKQKGKSHIMKKANRGYLNYGNQNDGFFIDKKK